MRPSRSCAFVAALSLAAGACSGTQSVLSPAGPQAGTIAHLWWIFFAILGSIYVIVISAAVYGLLRRRRSEPAADGVPFYGEPGRSDTSEGSITTVVTTAVVLTALILVVFVFVNAATEHALASRTQRNPVEIVVNGHQWWWELTYKSRDTSQMVTTANEIHIPLGEPVLIRATSQDVIHSLWIPNLHGKQDLIPGHERTLWIQADVPGVYRGQCAEFCGLEHAQMALLVFAEPAEQFNRWLEQQRRAGVTPSTPDEQRGQQVFLTGPCALCHNVTGTRASARVGPDLTHIGSRSMLAAGMFPNTPGYLGGWIIGAQQLKPGAQMPNLAIKGEDLQPLIAYLQSLK